MLDISNDISGYKWYNVAFWKKCLFEIRLEKMMTTIKCTIVNI